MSFTVTAAIAAFVGILANSAYVNGECAVTPGADGLVTIPANWTAIPEYAFWYCTDLRKVLIPAKITEIQASAFSRSGLEEVEFEANSQLETIYKYAFDGTNITSIEIPSSVTEILNYAFASSRLEEVEFEANSELETIGAGAFQYTKTVSIEIPSSVTSFGSNVFRDTPCSDSSTFQPGTMVVNCRTYVAQTPVPSAVPSVKTILIVAVLDVCVLVALVVFFLLKQRDKKTGEDEGVNSSGIEMIEGNELNEIEIGEIEGHQLT